jgi:hypothetical protein
MRESRAVRDAVSDCSGAQSSVVRYGGVRASGLHELWLPSQVITRGVASATIRSAVNRSGCLVLT